MCFKFIIQIITLGLVRAWPRICTHKLEERPRPQGPARHHLPFRSQMFAASTLITIISTIHPTFKLHQCTPFYKFYNQLIPFHLTITNSHSLLLCLLHTSIRNTLLCSRDTHFQNIKPPFINSLELIMSFNCFFLLNIAHQFYVLLESFWNA